MKGNFNKLIDSQKPVLVDFHAEWCGPCKAQGPIIKEVAKEVGEKARVIKVDIDKNPHIAKQFQVMSVPTLALFKEGKLIWKQSGVQSKQNLIQIVEQHTEKKNGDGTDSL